MYSATGPDNSSLISTENAVPSSPANKARIRHRVFISLALLDKNQRFNHSGIPDFLNDFFIIKGLAKKCKQYTIVYTIGLLRAMRFELIL